MAYDPQRSHPRKPVADDETAPIDAILDDMAEEAAADEAERAGMADVVEALVDEIVEDEAIIGVLASQPPAVEVVEIIEVVEIEQEVLAVVDATPRLPEGVEIEVRDDEVVVRTPGADVEVAASGTDVIVHTDDADIDVNSGDDVVVVSTVDEEIIVDVSPVSERRDVEVMGRDRSGLRRGALLAGVAALAVAVVVWLRRRRRPTD